MKMFETKMPSSSMEALESWKNDVKKAYPEIANRLKFKSLVKQGVDTISAEIGDRKYGVFDVKSETGVILD